MIRLLYFKCRIFLVMFVFLAAIFLGSVDVAASTAYTGMRGITAQQAVNEMGVGWNLGNTFDAPNETAWGNPTTTHAMIDKIKQQGFNTIRIPISWTGHFGGAPNYTIDSAWFNRVEQVMNYAFDNNMYVIINSHHDTSWQIPTYAYQSQGVNTITKIWTQIANRFKNYGDYLIFETLNEPRLVGSAEEWSGGTAEGRAVVNAYNLAAVNAIRATGGNNATRFIMVPTYAASAVPAAINDLVIPNNDSRVIVSLHMYSPWSFAGDYPGTSTWGSSSDISSLEAEFNAVYNVFGRNGRAVVIGEWGSINKNNLSSRITHIQNYMKFARARGMATIWWDNGNANAGDDSWAIFNRWGLYWHFPDIANALVSNVGPATPTTTPTRTPTPTPVRTATPKPTPTATSHISTPTPTPVTGGYVVTYSIVNDWGTGATVNVTIKNNTSTAVNGWTLAWTFPGNQTVTNMWNATYTQSGASVTAKDAGYNAYISANGGEVNFGFNLNYTGTNAKPASFTLNGAACQVQ